MGASAWYEHWLGRIEELRTRVAAFWGSAPGEIALLPSTSVALSVVAESRAARSGRNRVVCTELDFPTLAYQWAVKPEVELVVLESPDGIRVRPGAVRGGGGRAHALPGHEPRLLHHRATSRTSHAWPTSPTAPAPGASSTATRARGRCRSTWPPPGWTSTRRGRSSGSSADPGLAYLYVRGDLIEELEPRITSWFATERQFDFDLEGVRVPPGRASLRAGHAGAAHRAHGAGRPGDRGRGGDRGDRRPEPRLTEQLVERCRDAGFELRLPEPRPPLRHRHGAARRSGRRPSAPGARAASSSTIGPGFVRVSPHFYNTEEEVDRCVDALARQRA